MTGTSRTPHGVRGLKSYPARHGRALYSRTPHGVRGLKWLSTVGFPVYVSRTPHGVRGLKYTKEFTLDDFSVSHPSRGAWIEMDILALRQLHAGVAPLTGCVD